MNASTVVTHQQVENQIVEITTSKNSEIQNDEYDTADIVSKIEKVNQVMLRILFAGASKSHICQKPVDKGYTILFVCPTNTITINKIFGISFGEG